MAVAINLASLKNPGMLRKRVIEELKNLQQQGLEVNLCETKRGQLTFLGCNIVQNCGTMSLEQAQELLRCFLAKALADIIITHCEENIVRKLVHQKYRRFSMEERQRIIDLVLQNNAPGMPTLPERHAKIASKLMDYFNCSDTIILEGFVRFRLQDYQYDLKKAIGRAADDVEGEKEYREFIQLLRYFVDLHESQWLRIHVVPYKNGGFQLLDEKSQPIKLGNLWDGFGNDADLTYGDLLISTLVCISPATIVFHIGGNYDIKNHELITTIQDIFPGQVTVCSGCCLCQQ